MSDKWHWILLVWHEWRTAVWHATTKLGGKRLPYAEAMRDFHGRQARQHYKALFPPKPISEEDFRRLLK